MKTSFALTTLAALATTFAIGCAAPSDSADAPEAPVAPALAMESAPEADAPSLFDVAAADAAQSAAQPGSQSFTSDMLNIILGRLTNDGLDLLLRGAALGDRTGEQLADIIRAIDELRRQLTEAENRMHASIAYAAVTAKADSMRGSVVGVLDTLAAYRRVAVWAQRVTTMRESGDVAGAEKADYDLQDAVFEFVKTFESGRVRHAVTDLNLSLVGTTGPNGTFTELHRWYLRSNNRILTSAHSKALQASYVYWEDMQGLATLLQAECNYAVRYGARARREENRRWPLVDTGVCTRDEGGNTELGEHVQEIIDKQRAFLPRPIEVGSVIDQGTSHGSHTGDTTNKPMFMTIDGTFTARPTDANARPPREGSAQERINEIQSVGCDGWRLPSQAELAPLFAGAQRGESLAQVMNRRFATQGRFENQPWIWTNNQVDQKIVWFLEWQGDWGRVRENTYRTYTGYRMDDGLKHRGQPVMPYGNNNWNDSRRADAAAEEAWANGKGGVIATCNTGGSNYM